MGRILRLVVTVALMVIMFAVGWVVAKTGMGSGVDSVLLTDRERQFTERMSGTSLIGRFTIRHGHPPDMARRFASASPWARCGAWIGWNAKALVKPVLGSSYARFADWLLEPARSEHHG